MTPPVTPPKPGDQQFQLPQHPEKPPYPQESDEKIRRAAKFVFYDEPIHVLDMIKNELFGNAEKAERLALKWGQDTTMNDDKTEINSAKDNLSAYWEGPAYNAFNSYAGNTVGVLDKDLAVMGSIAGSLGQCVATVYQTYASAISFIGNCIANLGAADAWVIIAAATVEIPGVDLFTAGNAINKVIDALSTFVRDVTSLISSATTQIGQYKAQGITFANLGQQFQHPEPLPEASRHVGEWHVHPNR